MHVLDRNTVRKVRNIQTALKRSLVGRKIVGSEVQVAPNGAMFLETDQGRFKLEVSGPYRRIRNKL